MLHCPHCRQELDAEGPPAARCPHCGGALYRTTDSAANDATSTQEETHDDARATVELEGAPPRSRRTSAEEHTEGSIDLDLIGGGEPAGAPGAATVEFSGRKTKPVIPTPEKPSDGKPSDPQPDEEATDHDTDDGGDTQIEPAGEGALPFPKRSTVTDDAKATVELAPGHKFRPASGPQTDSPAPDASPADDPDSRETVDSISLTGLEAPATGETPLRQTATEPKRSTHQINRDLTVEGDAVGAVDADLARRITGEWGAVVAESDHERQTIRTPDAEDSASGSIKDSIGAYRSTLPIRSRSLRERSAGDATTIRPNLEAVDYELLKRIGEGGMGVVYAAHQSSIARTVAVKMLKPGVKVTSDQRDKFLSEAVVTGDLDHPNIVPIYDLGANDKGALFYSMKRVKGTPWDEAFKEKSLEENLSILLRVADAMAFAHASGVVHRDLKPENVMLGDFGEVLVMDWGLARITPKFRNSAAVYQSHSLGGTPAYMAPEMARGPVDIIDARSDVYLLGAILYEIITGEPPHSGDDVMKCLMAAAQNKIDPIEPQILKGRGELASIAMRAMQTKSADRYPSVKEFQAAIRDYQSHSESLVLSTLAGERLAEAERTGDYALYASAQFGFQESLALWPENAAAQQSLQAAKVAYARAAHDKGDYDLAASLLDAQNAEHQELLSEIKSARAERDARHQRLRRAKRLALALVAAVIGVTTAAYFAVRAQRNQAIESEKQAVAARDEAQSQRQRAEREQARAEASEAQAVAEKQAAIEARKQEERARLAADDARQQAEIARQEEVVARQEAVAQRANAERARQNKEYQSYVAQIGLAAEKIEGNAFGAARSLLEQCQPAELRHWEWGRLAHLCELSAEQFNFAGPVGAVAYSPAEERLATGDWTGRLTVRDLTGPGGAELFSVRHGERLFAVAFSPDGAQIATGSSDGEVRVVDATSGKLLRTMEGHAGGVLTIAYAPEGRTLLTGGYDNVVRLWDIETGRQLSQQERHTWWVWSVQFSPAGSRAVSAGQDGRVIVWDVDSDEQALVRPREFLEHQGPVYAAAFSNDGERIASAGYDGVVRLWSPGDMEDSAQSNRSDPAPAPAGTPTLELAAHEMAVHSVAFSANGEWLLSGGADNTLRLWNAATGAAIKALRGHGGRVMASAFSPDGERAASGSFDQSVRLWDVRDYAERRALQTRSLTGHRDAILSAQFSADGSQVVTASRDRTASVWDAATGEPLQSFGEGHEFLASTAEFFAGGRRLATGAGDNTVRLWDVATGGEYAVLRPTGRRGALAVAPAGEWLVTGGRGNRATVWDAETGAQLAELAGHEAEVTAAAIAPAPDGDGVLIATGDDLGRIRLWRRRIDGAWDQAALPQSVELRGHSRTITGLAFARDGARLISCSGDNTCGQWDTATGKELRKGVLKHQDWVASLAVSADGELALTASEDGLAQLWRLADAKVIARTKSPGAAFTSVDLSPSGDRALLASAGEGVVWDWNLGDAAGEAGDTPRVLLAKGDLNRNVWAARFVGGAASDPARILTLGGNDAALWNLPSKQPVVTFSPHGAVASAAMSPSGSTVATGSWDHSVKLWDAATGRVLKKLVDAHAAPVTSVAFAPGSETELLTASDDQTTAIWDLREPAEPALVLRGHTGRVEGACYSADGARVLTVSSDQTARVWDRATGELVLTLKGHAWGLLCGEFSPDGALIVTGAADNNAIVWDAHSGNPLRTLAAHSAPITSVAFSPDGARILTGSQDGAAKLWDAAEGQEILTLAGHSEAVTAVDFSPSGLEALTASRDGVAIVWQARPWDGQGGEELATNASPAPAR